MFRFVKEILRFIGLWFVTFIGFCFIAYIGDEYLNIVFFITEEAAVFGMFIFPIYCLLKKIIKDVYKLKNKKAISINWFFKLFLVLSMSGNLTTINGISYLLLYGKDIGDICNYKDNLITFIFNTVANIFVILFLLVITFIPLDSDSFDVIAIIGGIIVILYFLFLLADCLKAVKMYNKEQKKNNPKVYFYSQLMALIIF